MYYALYSHCILTVFQYFFIFLVFFLAEYYYLSGAIFHNKNCQFLSVTFPVSYFPMTIILCSVLISEGVVVLQSKFMPYCGDTHIISCARDGHVRLAELSSTGICKNTKKLAQHHGSAHKVRALESPHSGTIDTVHDTVATPTNDMKLP